MVIRGTPKEMAAFVKELQRLPSMEIKLDKTELVKGCLEAIRGTLPEKPIEG